MDPFGWGLIRNAGGSGSGSKANASDICRLATGTHISRGSSGTDGRTALRSPAHPEMSVRGDMMMVRPIAGKVPAMLETLTAPQTIDNMQPLQGVVPVEGTALDLLLRPSPEDAFEWSVSLNGRCTDWRDLESRDQVVGLVQLISTDGDWLIIQSKNLDYLPLGRYARRS